MAAVAAVPQVVGAVVNVLLLSGGLDSMVLLARLVAAGDAPSCLTFVYEQRHSKEVDHATRIAKKYSCAHRVMTIEGVFSGCPMTGQGRLAKPSDTVIPNRNAVMISMAAAIASEIGGTSVFIGCTASDHSVYADCRPSFIEAMSRAMYLSCGVSVKAPFALMSKGDVVADGKTLGVDFGMAWSCYEGGESACGKCGACRARAEAGA